MKKVGVIVGRFQVPELHAGHRHLIETVTGLSDQVLVVLGHAGIISEKNPFSKKMRREVIEKAYPDVLVTEINDHPSDEEWSRDLDKIISRRFPDAEVTLYGSRDSFLPSYSGKFSTTYIPPIPAPSGTDVRKQFFQSQSE